MCNDIIRIDPNKNAKLTYYVLQGAKLFIPGSLNKKRLRTILNDKVLSKQIKKRVDYYNKQNTDFSLPNDASTIKTFKKEKKKTYFFDLYEYLRYFDKGLKFSYLFGDVTTVPAHPHLLKSRPISGDNRNSVLMKLNKVRHFIFVDDTIAFEDKKAMLVWRGKAHGEHRKAFLSTYFDTPSCDIGDTYGKKRDDNPWYRSKLSISRQLEYKFILSIEGKDVASNLKWVMSSNSLAFMCRPNYETWFMEGSLIPDHHYVLLKDDHSDLQEKIDYYSKHTDEALRIITHANEYVKQFQDDEIEDIISLLVLKRYFKRSGQL